MGEILGRPVQPQHPEAPIKGTAEAYVRGAFTTLFCIALSDKTGQIALDSDQLARLTSITEQAASRPQERTDAYNASVEASTLWFQAAEASLGMFGELIQTNDQWQEAFLIAAGIREGDESTAMQEKRVLLERWMQGGLTEEEQQSLPETVLPVWCSENSGLSSATLSDMSAARKLYSDLWNFSWDVDPEFWKKIHAHRR